MEISATKTFLSTVSQLMLHSNRNLLCVCLQWFQNYTLTELGVLWAKPQCSTTESMWQWSFPIPPKNRVGLFLHLCFCHSLKYNFHLSKYVILTYFLLLLLLLSLNDGINIEFSCCSAESTMISRCFKNTKSLWTDCLQTLGNIQS